MKFAFVFSAVAVLHDASNHQVEAIQCGTRLTHPCLADADIRYDASASNEIQDQAEVWSHYPGYYAVEIYDYDDEGRPKEEVEFFPEEGSFPFSGTPYKKFPFFGFFNITISGSRMYRNRYIVYPPAPAEYCAQEVPSGYANVVGNGECGVNGMTFAIADYGTSSYEKDGSIVVLGGDTDDASPSRGQSVGKNRFTPLDSLSWFLSHEVGPDLKLSESFVCPDAEANCAEAYSTIDAPGISGFNRILYTKLESEEAFIEAVEQALATHGILEEDKAEFPQTMACITGNCPTEEDWCQQDPECSVSPFQEPDSQVKTGVIVGFCALGTVLLLAAAYALHRHQLSQQAARNRRQFAKSVARDITIRPSRNQLSPDDMEKQFQKIAGNSGGTISREALWKFLSSGEAGTVNQNDFNALFNCMDNDKSGQVDFLEFMAFLSQCVDEFEELGADASADLRRKELQRALSRKISERIHEHTEEFQGDETEMEQA